MEESRASLRRLRVINSRMVKKKDSLSEAFWSFVVQERAALREREYIKGEMMAGGITKFSRNERASVSSSRDLN